MFRAILTVALMASGLGANAHFTPLPLGNYNMNIRTLAGAANQFPVGTTTLALVPFAIPATGNNAWDADLIPDRTLTLSNLNVIQAARIHFLVNCRWGDASRTAEVVATNGLGDTYSKVLECGVDFRDYLQESYVNTINNATTTRVFTAGFGQGNLVRLDKFTFNLPLTFTNFGLKGITWHDSGETDVCATFIPAITVETGVATVSGHVNWAGGKPVSDVSVEFRNHGTMTNVGSPVLATIDASGDFSFIAPGLGNYDITVQPRGYLRRTIQADLTYTNVTGAVLNMVPANIVGDNVIDLSDYIKLVVYFNRLSTDEGWNTPDAEGIRPSDADISGDGVVDLTDYTTLVLNFNIVGDN